MSRIRSKDTKPELLVRRLIRSLGYGYTLHGKMAKGRDLPGKPDVVFKARKKVVFVNGCFWHQHDCRPRKEPKTNPDFWKKKFERNVQRDLENRAALEGMGWRFLTVWECEIKDEEKLRAKLDKFINN